MPPCKSYTQFYSAHQQRDYVRIHVTRHVEPLKERNDAKKQQKQNVPERQKPER